MTIRRFRQREGLTYMPSVMSQFAVGKSPTTWYDAAAVPSAAISSNVEKCFDELHPGPPYKTGGPLDLWKFQFSSPIFGAFNIRSSRIPTLSTKWYKGRWFRNPLPETSFPLSGWKTNWDDVSSFGPQGWNKFRPIRPGASLGTALAELRETWSSLMKRAIDFKQGYKYWIQNPAKTLLESNFGWIPLANDIEDAINTFRNVDAMIDRIRKMNGRWEHRGGVVAKMEESWETTGNSHIAPILATSFYTAAGQSSPYIPPCTIKWKYESKVWFEGMFKYYIPNIDTKEWESTARRKLLGLELTPSTLWELIPYSWLADWVSNAGDMFANMDDGLAENLVCKYAYVMRHSIVTAELNQRHIFMAPYPDGVRYDNSHTIIHTWERKQRVQATPFGFGLDAGSFTPKQIAIMAALGLSR